MHQESFGVLLARVEGDYHRQLADMIEAESRSFDDIARRFRAQLPPPTAMECAMCPLCGWTGPRHVADEHHWREHTVRPRRAMTAIVDSVMTDIIRDEASQFALLIAAAKKSRVAAYAAQRAAVATATAQQQLQPTPTKLAQHKTGRKRRERSPGDEQTADTPAKKQGAHEQPAEVSMDCDVEYGDEDDNDEEEEWWPNSSGNAEGHC